MTPADNFLPYKATFADIERHILPFKSEEIQSIGVRCKISYLVKMVHWRVVQKAYTYYVICEYYVHSPA